MFTREEFVQGVGVGDVLSQALPIRDPNWTHPHRKLELVQEAVSYHLHRVWMRYSICMVMITTQGNTIHECIRQGIEASRAPLSEAPPYPLPMSN